MRKSVIFFLMLVLAFVSCDGNINTSSNINAPDPADGEMPSEAFDSVLPLLEVDWNDSASNMQIEYMKSDVCLDYIDSKGDIVLTLITHVTQENESTRAEQIYEKIEDGMTILTLSNIDIDRSSQYFIDNLEVTEAEYKEKFSGDIQPIVHNSEGVYQIVSSSPYMIIRGTLNDITISGKQYDIEGEGVAEDDSVYEKMTFTPPYDNTITTFEDWTVSDNKTGDVVTAIVRITGGEYEGTYYLATEQIEQLNNMRGQQDPAV